MNSREQAKQKKIIYMNIGLRELVLSNLHYRGTEDTEALETVS